MNFSWGRLTTEVMTSYTHLANINSIAVGGGACVDYRRASVKLGYYYRLYGGHVAADPHINETSRNLNMFNDALRNDCQALFGSVLGDCIDVRNNFLRYLESLSYDPEIHSCDHPIFHVLGNHDTFFNGWNDFKEYIGAFAYWFEVLFAKGKDLFITLDMKVHMNDEEISLDWQLII